MKKVAILGSAIAGGAAQIIEAMRLQNDYEPVFILDRDFAKIKERIFEVPVLGDTEEIANRWYKKEFDEVIIAIGGDLNERKRLYNYIIDIGIPLANVIDSSVRLGMGITLGTGNVILNDTYIGNNVSMGNNNYILNQCSFQHDTKIKDHNYFATNVTVGAKVTIGSLNRINIKCVIETKATIGDGHFLETGRVIAHDNKSLT